MKLSIDKAEKYTTITLQNEKIDSTVSPDLKSKFITLNAEGHKNIILDMSHVKYVDSSGLSSILVANRLCNNIGGSMVLCCISDHVMKLITISQLQNILTIVPTLEEAVDAIFLNEIENDLKENPEEDED